MRRTLESIAAGAIAALVMLWVMGASCNPKPPQPHPTPTPQPTATPTPVPTPTPTPIACATLESFKLDVRKLARVIVDATPGHGFPDCSTNVRPCTTPGSFQRLSPEGGPTVCEKLAGPYAWTFDGVPCNEKPCTEPDSNCFSNNNPLQYVVCKSGLVGVTGGNSFGTLIAVQVP